MNIFRSNKPEASQDSSESASFFSKAKSSVIGTRRALGDITNSVGGQPAAGSDVSKKFMSWFQGPSGASASAPESATAGSAIQVPPAPVVLASDPREYMQREADDIDARDAENPLLCPEYVNEMYDIFRQTERQFQVNPNYMSNQPHINDKMRTILIDWLVTTLLSTSLSFRNLYSHTILLFL